MAGLHRRKFVTIISDKFTDHYQGKVTEQELAEALQKLALLVTRLDKLKTEGNKQRSETLRNLKKLPLEKLQGMLAAKA